MIRLVCDGCDQEITDEDYCTPHELDCPNDHDGNTFVECECSLHFHNYCCPVCSCQGVHQRHYGFLWRCASCKQRFCWAEGSDNRPELCDRCWVIEMERNHETS